MGYVGKDREILCQEYSILINYSYVAGWGTLKDESAREKSKPNLKPFRKQISGILVVNERGQLKPCSLRFHHEN